MNYKAPVAEVICFETVNLIATSTGEVDNPENLNTWGKGIDKFAEVDLFR